MFMFIPNADQRFNKFLQNVSDLFPGEKLYKKSIKEGIELTGSHFLLGEIFEYCANRKLVVFLGDKISLDDKKFDVIALKKVVEEKVNGIGLLLFTTTGAIDAADDYIKSKQEALSSLTLKLFDLFPTMSESVSHIDEFWNGYSIFVDSTLAQDFLSMKLRNKFPDVHVSTYTPYKVEIFNIAGKKQLFKEFLEDKSNSKEQIFDEKIHHIESKYHNMPTTNIPNLPPVDEKTMKKMADFLLEKFMISLTNFSKEFVKGDIISLDHSLLTRTMNLKIVSHEKAKMLVEVLQLLSESIEGIEYIAPKEQKGEFIVAVQPFLFETLLRSLNLTPETLKDEMSQILGENMGTKDKKYDDELIDDIESPSEKESNSYKQDFNGLYGLKDAFPEFSKCILEFAVASPSKSELHARISMDNTEHAVGFLKQLQTLYGNSKDMYFVGRVIFIDDKNILESLLAIIK